MKIGVIETGNIGGTLAGKLSAADTISASRIREVRKGSGLWPTTSARSHFHIDPAPIGSRTSEGFARRGPAGCSGRRYQQLLSRFAPPADPGD
jgi:hypothetical protein